MAQLFFDIETIPDQTPGALNDIIANIKAPANLKKEETIQKWHEEKAHAAAEEVYAKTGLGGLKGEICSIAWAVDEGEIQGQIRKPGESEATLLTDFFLSVVHDIRRNGEGAHPRLEWVGHNVLEFDLRFIKQRCLIHRIHPDLRVPADARHNKGSVFDTMREWCGFRGFVSQDALCKAFGLAPKAGMTGADVWPAYQAERYEDILAYNRNDVNAVREMYKIMVSDRWSSPYAARS